MLDETQASEQMKAEVKEVWESWVQSKQQAECWADLEHLCRVALQRYLKVAQRTADVEHEQAWALVIAGHDPDLPEHTPIEPRRLDTDGRYLGRVGLF